MLYQHLKQMKPFPGVNICDKNQTLARGGSLLVLMLVLVQILELLGVLVSSPSLFTTVR